MSTKTTAPKAQAKTTRPAANTTPGKAKQEAKAASLKDQAKKAGLTETEQKALDPEARVTQPVVKDVEGLNQTTATEEEIDLVRGAAEVTLTSFAIEIVRDPMMKIGKRVFEHEIPILEELHGADKIVVDENSGRDETIVTSAEAEYDRLTRIYGEKGKQALIRVFGSNARGLASETGLPKPVTRVLGGRRQGKAQSAQRGAGV